MVNRAVNLYGQSTKSSCVETSQNGTKTIARKALFAALASPGRKACSSRAQESDVARAP